MADESRKDLEEKGERQARLESPEHLGAEGEVSAVGTAGGQPAKKIGKADEEKRAFEKPAGVTRATKGDSANPNVDGSNS